MNVLGNAVVLTNAAATSTHFHQEGGNDDSPEGAWRTLNEDLQRKILHNISSIEEIKDKRFICRQWARLLKERIEVLCPNEGDASARELAQSIGRFAHLRILHCRATIRPADLPFERGFGRHLTMLSIRDCEEWTVEGLSQLSRLTTLVHLDLREGERFERGPCEKLSALTRLTSLELYNWSVLSDNILETVAKLSSLSKVGLNTLGALHTLEPFISPKKLQHLCLITKARLEDTQVSDLSALSHLSTLMLAPCCGITDVSIRQLCSLTKMQNLSLLASDISAEGLQMLHPLRHLAQLDLSFSLQWTEKMCSALAQFSALTELRIVNCSSDRTAPLAMQSLRALGTLQRLEMGTNLVVQLDSVGHLTQLTKLGIGGCFPMSCKHLQSLTSLTNLVDLNLAHLSEVRDLDLIPLRDLPALEFVDLTSCPQITNLGCQILRESYQHLDILR